MGGKKMLTEIALQFLGDIHSIVRTNLPYPWDFCRVDIAEDTRLVLNSGSYFVVYAAFIFWFIKYIVQNIQALAREELTSKDYIIAVMLAFAAATQMLWPIFLISTWFVTCSFYPWFTALLVLSLNFPHEAEALIQFTTIKSRLFIQASAMAISSISQDVWAEDEFSDEDPQRDDVNVMVESIRRESGRSISLPQVVGTSFISDTSITDTSISRSDSTDVSSPTRDIVYVYGNRRTVPSVEYEVYNIMDDALIQQRRQTRMRQDQSIRDRESMTENNARHRETRSKRSHKAEGPSVRRRVRSTGTIKKKGYCGRCWRVDGLPFMQGFSVLRQPYTTRSGSIYGPPVHFLKMDEFIEQYGL